jgi:hypothetical protein
MDVGVWDVVSLRDFKSKAFRTGTEAGQKRSCAEHIAPHYFNKNSPASLSKSVIWGHWTGPRAAANLLGFRARDTRCAEEIPIVILIGIHGNIVIDDELVQRRTALGGSVRLVVVVHAGELVPFSVGSGAATQDFEVAK